MKAICRHPGRPTLARPPGLPTLARPPGRPTLTRPPGPPTLFRPPGPPQADPGSIRRSLDPQGRVHLRHCMDPGSPLRGVRDDRVKGCLTGSCMGKETR